MANFGIGDLRVVNPYEVAFREAVSAVGGAHVLQTAQVFKSVADAVADCSLVVGTSAAQRRELQVPIEPLQMGMARIQGYAGRVGLLFGSEKFGLSNEDLSHCHWLMRIPTREEHISMNLGQAVAICLYELIRDAKSIAKFERLPEKAIPANAGEVERFTNVLTEALSLSGFLDRRTVADADDRIRRLVRRLRLPQRDADMWTGIMRQIVWKLNHPAASKPKS